MIKPPKLKDNATIGVVSPSYWLAEDKFEQSAQSFTDRGFTLIRGKSTYLRDNLFAGTPEQRAADLMDMFANPDIDAILCARGGYGANRVLHLLDYEIIRKHPKIFMGFSDITALHTSITQKTGVVTFHAPLLLTYNDGYIDYNFNQMINTLSGNPNHIITPPDGLLPKVLRSGIAEGPLWGGNICLLSNRLGTNDALNTDGVVLFLEDLDDKLYHFDRLMYQLKTTGMFEKITGLIIGELVDMKDTNPPFGKTTDEIVMDICGEYNFPIVTNFPCGHGKYQATLPISVPVKLHVTDDSFYLTITESPVR